MNNSNNQSARESFVHAKKMFFKAFRDKFGPVGQAGDQACQNFVDSLKLSQSEIRLEVGLDANKSAFVFGVTPNQANSSNTVFLTEQRLNLQDTFCINEYGIFVGFPPAVDSALWQLQTHGNPLVFTGANVASEIDGTLFNNGNFQMNCNNDVIMPYRGLFNHWYRAQTQQTAAFGAGSPLDQIRGAEDGMITDEPNLVLVGSKNYVPQINLKKSMATGTFTTERAILMFRGILAQNSTVVS